MLQFLQKLETDERGVLVKKKNGYKYNRIIDEIKSSAEDKGDITIKRSEREKNHKYTRYW